MNNIVLGSAVISKAGRDKGKIMAVVGIDEKYAIIADGQMRKLENPKRKKIIHLQVTNTVLAPEELESNRKIRNALKSHFGGDRKGDEKDV